MTASEHGDGNNADGVRRMPPAGGEARLSVFDRLGDGPIDMVALEALMREDDQRHALAALDRAIARRRQPSGGEPGR